MAPKRFKIRSITEAVAVGNGICKRDAFVQGHRLIGFTLIELLVVLVAIAVLAALLLPLLENARSSTRTATGLSNQRQIAIGIGTYTIDFDETLPLGFSDIGGAYTNWASSVSTYLGSSPQASFP